MKPLPIDDKVPMAGGADHDDLILWLAYKEAKACSKRRHLRSPMRSKQPLPNSIRVLIHVEFHVRLPGRIVELNQPPFVLSGESRPP